MDVKESMFVFLFLLPLNDMIGLLGKYVMPITYQPGYFKECIFRQKYFAPSLGNIYYKRNGILAIFKY